MGDLTKLKVAVGQPDLFCGDAAANERARERMVERAVDLGADLLVMPGSLEDERDVHLIVLNDSRIDVAGNAVHLEACGETYRIGLEPDDLSCDFAVLCDVGPFTVFGDLEDDGLRTLPKGVPTIYLRPVGMRNIGKKVLAYDGGSRVYDAKGRMVCALRDDFEEDIAVMRFSDEGVTVHSEADKLLSALVKTLRRFDEQVLFWNPKWIIGLSGGLDSSIVATLLTLAFGADRVVGYNLATRYNSDATKSNAASLAKALGIELKNGSIEQLIDATSQVVSSYGYPDDVVSGLVAENVQARLRGHALSTLAAIEGGVVVNNGNRIECALGYATMYGDAIGAIGPIGDLTKVQLFGLARAINATSEVPIIPSNLLPVVSDAGLTWQTPPSAELAEGQTDPMKWFYHDWLISRLLDAADIDVAACEILEGYALDKLTSTQVGTWVRFYGLDEPNAFADDLDWVLRTMKKAVFKRIQAPPYICLASPASVAAGPESQGAFAPSVRYRELEARVRAL